MSPATEDQRLLDQARRLRAEAHRLLHEDGLLRLVNAVGPAAVVGSVAMDLMTWPELDINVQLPHERDVATLLGLGTRIATGFRVRHLAFWNHYVRPDGPYHDGLYAGSRLLVGDREWKLDLWGFGEAAFRSRLQASEALRRRLAGADRLAILRVKDAVCRRPEYRSAVTSGDVYEAVAGGGVRTVAQFDDWLRTRRGATPWHAPLEATEQ